MADGGLGNIGNSSVTPDTQAPDAGYPPRRDIAEEAGEHLSET